MQEKTDGVIQFEFGYLLVVVLILSTSLVHLEGEVERAGIRRRKTQGDQGIPLCTVEVAVAKSEIFRSKTAVVVGWLWSEIVCCWEGGDGLGRLGETGAGECTPPVYLLTMRC